MKKVNLSPPTGETAIFYSRCYLPFLSPNYEQKT